MYVYNGTDSLTAQAFYRLDNADVPASSLVTGTGVQVANTGAWLKLSSNDTTQPASVSRQLCTAQCFYDLVVAVAGESAGHGGRGRRAIAHVRRCHDSIDGRRRELERVRAPTVRILRNAAHVDVRAVVFHPRNPSIALGGFGRRRGAQ